MPPLINWSLEEQGERIRGGRVVCTNFAGSIIVTHSSRPQVATAMHAAT